MELLKRSQVKQTESPIEDILLRELHILGIYPAIQFEVPPYRIDLALPEQMIAIECDGKEWHSSDVQIERDAKRDEFLRKNGWRVIRFYGKEIYRDADRIAKLIIGDKSTPRKKYMRHLNRNSDNPDESFLSGEELEDLYAQRKQVIEEEEEYGLGKFERVGVIAIDRFNF